MRLLRAVEVTAVLWFIALLIAAGIASEGAASGLSFLGVLVTAVAAYFQQRSVPRLGPRTRRRAAAAVLLLDAVVTCGWAGWRSYEANRPVDVTAQVALSANRNVRPGGHAVLAVDIAAQRSVIVIVFDIADSNRLIGTCRPNTRLSVTPDTGGNRGGTSSAVPGEPIILPLLDSTRHLRLDIEVVNVRDDANCAVDISVPSARLTNG
jgi:hypothetical protein